MKIEKDMSHAEQQRSREQPISSASLLLCVRFYGAGIQNDVG
jgi:hypothetical protein